MINRVKRLKPVQELASQDERQAAVRLGERIARVDEAQRRLDELLTWEQDYTARMREGVVSLSELHSFRLFMSQLGEAIAQQRAVLADAEQGALEARDHWQSKYTRCAALDKIVQQYLRDERQAAERREQSQLDEFNTRQVPFRR